MSVSPLPHNLDSPYLVHTLILEGTCQPGICHLTLTSFSWSNDLNLYFCDQIIVSILLYNLGYGKVVILCPTLMMECTYLCMSPQFNFSLCSCFTFISWYFDIVHYLTKFCTQDFQGAGETQICVYTCWVLFYLNSSWLLNRGISQQVKLPVLLHFSPGYFVFKN